MTGFGRGEAENEERKFLVEIKSVNHRYLDLNIRLPRKLIFLENEIRSKISEFVSRGKVDIFITLNEITNRNLGINYQKEVALAYIEGIKQLSQDFDLSDSLNAYQLSRFPEVFSMNDIELSPEQENECRVLIFEAIEKAKDEFINSRKNEGIHLLEDINKKLDYIYSLVNKLEERSPKIIEEYRERINLKVSELLGNTEIEQSRIATEIVLYADKICVDEEMVRLKTHINHMKKTLDNENIGRKLDFLAQEMNREANTILSKSNDVEVSDIGISLKTEIEKIREQIQNIE